MENKNLLLIIGVVILGGIIFSTFSFNKETTSRQDKKIQNKKNDVTPSVLHEGDESVQESYSDGITLSIKEPQNTQIIRTSTVIVAGKTSAGADVFINDMELRANGSGDFSTQVTLDEGENNIIIFVNDSEGNSAEKELVVMYEPGE